MMKNRVILGALGFAAAMACGVFVSLQSSELRQFTELQTKVPGGRVPAAIRRDLDFSGLQGQELINASRKRLLTAARVILQDDQQGIELGHFVMSDADGRIQLACDLYDQIQMTFVAEGVASSGEKTEMTIQGPCVADQDITQIAPIWIPVNRILAQNPSDAKLTFDGGTTNFTFANVLDAWPTQWALESIRLYNSGHEDQEVTISHQEALQITNQSFDLNWHLSSSSSPTATSSTTTNQ